MGATKKVIKTTNLKSKISQPVSKSSKTAPKKSVIVSKKVVKGPDSKTAKSIPVKHKVVYTNTKKTNSKVKTSNSSKRVSNTPKSIPVKHKVVYTETPKAPNSKNVDSIKPTSNIKETTPATNVSEPKPIVDTQQYNTVAPNNPAQGVNPSGVNKSYTVNQPQVNNSQPQNGGVETQVNNNQNINTLNEQKEIKSKKKKKKHVWAEVLTAVALFGGVLGGVGYYVYQLVTQEQKQEEYKREVESGSVDTISVSGKQQDKDNYVISVSAKESSVYEVSEIVSVKIGDEVISKDNYEYKDGKIIFKISYLKEHPGKIIITANVIKIPSIKFIDSNDEVEINKSITFKVEVKDKLDTETIKWSSSKPSVASIKDEGKEECVITGVSEGKTTIKASVRNKSVTCEINVVPERVEISLSYKAYDKSGLEIIELSEETIKDVEYYKIYCEDASKYKEGHHSITVPDTYTPKISGATAKPITGFYYNGNVGAFEGCETLEKVTFEKPENFNGIDKYAFRNCKYLKHFGYLPNITYIDTYAFYGCKNIKSLTFPKSLEYIKKRAFSFENLSSLDVKEIILEDQENMIWYCNKSEKREMLDFKNVSASEIAYLITVNSADDDDIFKLTNAECKFGYVGYSESDTPTKDPDSISYYKIYCANLDRLAPKGTIKIPECHPDNKKPIKGFGQIVFLDNRICGFEGCENIEKIEFEKPTNITSIDYYAFRNCINIDSINLSTCTNLKTIGGSSFQNCTKLSSVILPNCVEEILELAFCNCPSLKRFNNAQDEDLGVCSLPTSIATIGRLAFATSDESKSSKTNFKTIEFNNTSNYLDIHHLSFGNYDDTNGIFSKDNVAEGGDIYYLKNNLLSNDYYILYGFSTIGCMTVKINAKCSIIANYLFEKGDKSITKLLVLDALEYIPSYAFYNCTGFDNNSIVFYNGTTSKLWTIYKYFNLKITGKEKEHYDPTKATQDELIKYLQGSTIQYVWKVEK